MNARTPSRGWRRGAGLAVAAGLLGSGCGASSTETATFEVEQVSTTTAGLASSTEEQESTPSVSEESTEAGGDDAAEGQSTVNESGSAGARSVPGPSGIDMVYLGAIPDSYEVPSPGDSFDAFTAADLLPADAVIFESLLDAQFVEGDTEPLLEFTITFGTGADHDAATTDLTERLELAGWEVGKEPEPTTSAEETKTWATFKPPDGEDFKNFFLTTGDGEEVTRGEYRIPEFQSDGSPPFYGSHGEGWFAGLPLPGFDLDRPWSFRSSITQPGITAHRADLSWELEGVQRDALAADLRAALPVGGFAIREDLENVPDNAEGQWYIPASNGEAPIMAAWTIRSLDDDVVHVLVSVFVVDR